MRKPKTVHVQKTLEKIKEDSLRSDSSSLEYALLLEQLSILVDISDRHDDEVCNINEVIGEMETSRRMLEEKFNSHLETSVETNTKINEIHERIMDPDDGLIVGFRDIERRVGDLEDHNKNLDQVKKEELKEEKEAQKTQAQAKREKMWQIIIIVLIALALLSFVGKELAIPLIKTLIGILA